MTPSGSISRGFSTFSATTRIQSTDRVRCRSIVRGTHVAHPQALYRSVVTDGAFALVIAICGSADPRVR